MRSISLLVCVDLSWLDTAGQRISRADGGRPLRGRRLADRLFSLCWQ
jgi:hypothetical protein